MDFGYHMRDTGATGRNGGGKIGKAFRGKNLEESSSNP
jgi:hypothetical protein